MQTSTGVLTEVKVAGPFKSNKGYKDYFRHSYSIGEQKFSKITNKAEPLFEQGTSVTVLFESIKTEKGIFNQIDKIVEAEEGTPASAAFADEQKPSAKPVTITVTTIKTPTSVTSTTGTPTLSIDHKVSDLTKNLMIARMNAVTSAIAYTSEQSAIGNGTQDIQEVLDIATEILKFTTEPLNHK